VSQAVCYVVYMTSLVMNPSGMGNDPMGVDLGAKHPHTQGEPLHRVTSMRS